MVTRVMVTGVMNPKTGSACKVFQRANDGLGISGTEINHTDSYLENIAQSVTKV